jgi:predicted aspartyl protease
MSGVTSAGEKKRPSASELRKEPLSERNAILEAQASLAEHVYRGEGDDMETATMGKVLVTAKLENLDDLFGVRKGLLNDEQVRRVEVNDALVDTGATGLLMPKRLIDQLGLDPVRMRPSRTIAGHVALQIYRAVRLTIQGRDCISDVAEVPDEFPVVIGQVPLELMDWVVDPKGQRLIGNPEHGGEHMIEV